MLGDSLPTTSSTSDETLVVMPDLKKDAPSADESKTIPSLESLHKHLENDFTASFYLLNNRLVPDHTGKYCEGKFQRKGMRNWFTCKGKYEIRIIDPIYVEDDAGNITGNIRILLKNK